MNKKYIIAGISLAVLVAALVGYRLFFSGPDQLEGRSIIVNNADQNTATAPQTPVTETPAQIFATDEKPAQTYQANEKITLAAPEKLPEAVKFKSFAYDQTAGKTISVSGSCSDAYYAIVIFRAQDDYKKNPASSVFNQAFECPTGRKFSNNIELRDFNLPSGEYYFFVADQGNRGAWYNPR